MLWIRVFGRFRIPFLKYGRIRILLSESVKDTEIPRKLKVEPYNPIFLKWSGSFFEPITKVLDGISGITKNIIFSIWGPVRGETLIFVCSYGCVVGRMVA